MAKSNEESIQIQLNQDLLNEAQELYEELGLDLNTAVQLFLKQSLNVGGLPFKLRRSRESRHVGRSNRQNRQNKSTQEENSVYIKPDIQASDAIINDL